MNECCIKIFGTSTHFIAQIMLFYISDQKNSFFFFSLAINLLFAVFQYIPWNNKHRNKIDNKGIVHPSKRGN